MATSVAAQIWSFLASKGLTAPQIAGIMGNLQVESGFNTGASNAAEGAIGLAQWEGGRRSALQQFASSVGGTETDLNVQLAFLWHELTTSESGALNALKGAATAQDAAAIFDQQYERSSGQARTQRVNNAGSILSAFQSGGVNGLNSLGGASTQSAGETLLTGGGSALSGVTPDYQSALGDVYQMFQAVPELKKMLDTAISSNEDPTHFFDVTFTNSAWYKSHSASFRAALTQQYADPGQFKQRVDQFQDSIKATANAMGLFLGATQIKNIAHQALFSGLDSDQAWLRRTIALTAKLPQNASGLGGEMANTVQQLKSLYAQYGQSGVSDMNFERAAQQIVSGNTTIDTYRQHAVNAAKSMFPALSKQLDDGLTVNDVAAPYQQSMSQLLEVSPASLDLSTPLIRQALQGKAGVSADKTSVPTSTPIWQFENQVRADPRWQYTDNAHQSMSTLALQLGRDWGFAS